MSAQDNEPDRFAEEVRAGLSGVTAEHPAVKAILRLLRRESEIEVGRALAPGLGNEARQFQAGRAAAAGDLVALLEDVVPKSAD